MITTARTPTFSLQCSPPHPDLHSFPTRRSSDLEVKAGATLGQGDIHGLRALANAAGKRWIRGVVLYTRSEEHTSELQSHHDLVCRLLLEKKKEHQNHTVAATVAHVAASCIGSSP